MFNVDARKECCARLRQCGKDGDGAERGTTTTRPKRPALYRAPSFQGIVCAIAGARSRIVTGVTSAMAYMPYVQRRCEEGMLCQTAAVRQRRGWSRTWNNHNKTRTTRALSRAVFSRSCVRY